MVQDNKNTAAGSEDEIDLIALAKTFWEKRRIVIKFAVIAGVIGLLIAILTPNHYTVSATIVPQTGDSQSSKLGGISSLAAMAGINIGSMGSSETLSPLVYSQIVQSVPFQLELMNTKFVCPEVAQPVSLFDYFYKYKKKNIGAILIKYTIGLPGTIIKALRTEHNYNQNKSNNSLLTLTQEQQDFRESLLEKISLEVMEKDGYIVLTTTFNDPFLTAQVTQKTLGMLQDYITRYKIEKAADQLHFIEGRYADKKAEFEEIQKKLALFRDRNRNVSTALAQTEEEQLLSQYNLANTVYTELAKQLEQAQIQVKEDTPILTVIDPVVIPTKKSGPKRLIILISSIFLGCFIGLAFAYLKMFFSGFKEKWNTSDPVT